MSKFSFFKCLNLTRFFSDLKTDNVLVDYDDDAFRRPHVVLSDFGCCLDDPSLNLKLPFTTEDTSRGGNRALMAPEVRTVYNGPFFVTFI
jgi:serine/threonine protein kinase